MNIRLLSTIALLFVGALLGYLVFEQGAQTPLRTTLAPIFQVAGKLTRAADTALGRVVPVDDIDEARFGLALRTRFNATYSTKSAAYRYVNRLLGDLARFRQKKFKYRAYVVNYGAPNAFAFPGGVILVTKGLLKTLKSEAQLVSIIGHEMGHIERDHCLNAIKFRLLLDKVDAPTLGQIADFLLRSLTAHSFSKTQENDADEYAFKLMTESRYDPSSMAFAFARFLKLETKEHANLFRDYFSSHPPMKLRVHKFREEAKHWWKDRAKTWRYRGRPNLRSREALSQKEFRSEWQNRATQ